MPESTTSSCSVETCENFPKIKGFCSFHYYRQVKGIPVDLQVPIYPEFCTVDGCSKPHRSLGLCSAHYQRYRNGHDLSAPLRYAHSTEPCSVQGCKALHYGKGFCQKHAAINRKYGLNAEQIFALPTSCQICSSTKHLHIDHDHACCPAQTSCGRCVRGVLCKKCNTMLGMAEDNPSVLRAAIRYLEGDK